ncbi:MAG: hypothetical protein QOF27_1941 [Gaiellaceae bacterium]|jgi:hypothetical protein|nr:hypothetical protein [Gaiellaceae bacterium]MDX6441321.1 hypothetical protein [Gaiellaceae bacterium]
MFRRLGFFLTVLGALAVVSVASAAYPAPFALQGGQGVLSNNGAVRFVASAAGESTLVRALKAKDGSILMSQSVSGSFGVPMLTSSGPGGGMFRDGSAFVLQSMGSLATTQFVLLNTVDLGIRDQIVLKGTFAFDALSPDGSKLYLVQHKSAQDIQHYIVRAYDLNAHVLMPGRIADKTQRSWVMQGWAVSRAGTANGRWAYTLYANPGGFPFVHALDTVRGVAHCVGLPWPQTESNQNKVFNFRLAVRGKMLVIKDGIGGTYRVVNTTNWHVSKR